jgi:hypothetical protein
MPGGGTTDDDALRATLELMDAPVDDITVRTSYNLAGMSFTPAELTDSIDRESNTFQVNRHDGVQYLACCVGKQTYQR